MILIEGVTIINPIKVLIADDNIHTANAIELALKTDSDFECVAVASDGLEAIKNIKSYLPDVILLDIVMPYNDGFCVLNFISEQESYNPIIIILSSLTTDYNIKKSSALGAKHFIAKPFDLNNLLNTIKEIYHMQDSSSISTSSKPETLVKTNHVEIIYDIVNSLDISIKLKGYTYLCELLIMCCSNVNKVYSLSKDLYPYVANKYSENVGSVERSIRTAIHKAWSQSKFNNSPLFNKKREKEKCPSNSEFIFTIIYHLISINAIK